MYDVCVDRSYCRFTETKAYENYEREKSDRDDIKQKTRFNHLRSFSTFFGWKKKQRKKNKANHEKPNKTLKI